MSSPRSIARVDLGAVAHNVGRLREAAGGASLIAVVKANAYGHGAVPVARAALEAGAESVAVAALDEAAELRDGGVEGRILVLGPIRLGEDVGDAASLGAELTVWTPEACAAAAQAGVPVHLKLDTGMGRLGARPEAVDDLVASARGARVVGLMTHFATADERDGENAAFMAEQLLRFRAYMSALAPRFPDAIAHAANSAACLRDRRTALDAVRCGIALYGCSPFGGPAADEGLRPALRWTSWLASVKTVRSQESVGYGRAHRAVRGTRIGLVPVGYADGVSRRLANVGAVLVGGRRVPIVGNVSMDQITIDLGPESREEVGEEVVLVGEQGAERISVEDHAAWRDTIGYEVMCGIGARVVRTWE